MKFEIGDKVFCGNFGFGTIMYIRKIEPFFDISLDEIPKGFSKSTVFGFSEKELISLYSYQDFQDKIKERME